MIQLPKFLLMLLILGSALSPSAFAQQEKESKIDLYSGHWDSVAVLPDGNETEAVFSLTRKDGKYGGSLKGDSGEAEFSGVDVNGTTILFAFTLNVGGVDRDLEIEAELQEDGSLSGKWIVMQDGAEAATGDWSATRKIETEILFDGNSMDNFRGYKEEAISDGWSIEDKTLHFNGTGSDIITKKEYGSFELTFDWKVSEGGNSGVMYRVSLGDKKPYLSGPEYQVLDDNKHRDGKKPSTSAGALYALHVPQNKQLNAVGKWNKSKIVLNGKKVEHWLNGTKVVDAEIGSDDWKEKVEASKFKSWEKFGKNKKGHLCFEDHGNKVWYRSITVDVLND